MLIIGSANKLNTQAMTDGFVKRNLSPTEAAADAVAFPRFQVDDTTWDWLESNTNAMTALLATPGQLSADEQAILSAISAQPTGAQVDVNALASALLGPLSTEEATALIDAMRVQLNK